MQNLWGSYRRMNPSSCLNRIEMLKTPYIWCPHEKLPAAQYIRTIMWNRVVKTGSLAIETEVLR